MKGTLLSSSAPFSEIEENRKSLVFRVLPRNCLTGTRFLGDRGLNCNQPGSADSGKGMGTYIPKSMPEVLICPQRSFLLKAIEELH